MLGFRQWYLLLSKLYRDDVLTPTTSGLTDSGLDQSYVYLIPANFGCIGTVTAVEFCYGIGNRDTIKVPSRGYVVFALSTLNGGGSSFTVKYSVEVYSYPDDDVCGSSSGGNRVCCDTVTLESTSPFQLLAGNDAVGIAIPPEPTARLQRLASLYSVTVFQQPISLVVDMMYNFGSATTDPFQALRLHLSK